MLNGKELLTSSLTAGNILLRVSDEDIFSRYVCNVKSPIKSPFREDNKPSCGFYVNRANRLVLHDFARDERWNCFNAVMEKTGLSFGKVLQMINQDFKLGLGTNSPSDIKLIRNIDNADKEKQDIKYNIKPYEQHELDYWSHYGITPHLLVKFGVYAVSSVKFGINGWRATKTNPIFVYVFTNMFKIYRPLNKDGYKWLEQTSGLSIVGLPQLPQKGKLLIITKALKDVMTLTGLGFPAICPMTESAHISEKTINILKKRFTHIVSLYDGDQTGRSSAERLRSQYNIPAMFLHKKKDVSDYYKHYGRLATFRMLKKHLAKTFNNERIQSSDIKGRSFEQSRSFRGLNSDIPF